MYKYKITCIMVSLENQMITHDFTVIARHPDECKQRAKEAFPNCDMRDIKIENLTGRFDK